MEELLNCYNKGCGLKFKPEENKEGSCRHHPGVPVFHDALKGWSCCKKRSTDFTDFLNIPGCTLGLHCNVKPAEPEKQPKSEKEETSVHPAPQPVIARLPQPMERPSADEPLTRLPMTVADSLKQALEKQMKEMTIEESAEADDGKVAKGTLCKNNACQAVYMDETSDRENCFHHPGQPVFHEGMKYWSCCQRKTSDFNVFLTQGGCSAGQHVWKKEEGEKQKVACRLDWHQTPTHVTISVFAKLAEPSKTWVEVNKVSAKVKVVFEGGKSQFQQNVLLRGVIDPEKSSVKLLGTKVEINLKKLEPGSWSSLEFIQPPPNSGDN